MFPYPFRGYVLCRDSLPSALPRKVFKFIHLQPFFPWLMSSYHIITFAYALVLQSSGICLWRRHIHVPSLQRKNPVHWILQTLQVVRILHRHRTIQQLQDLKDLSDDADEKVGKGCLCVVTGCSNTRNSSKSDWRSAHISHNVDRMYLPLQCINMYNCNVCILIFCMKLCLLIIC